MVESAFSHGSVKTSQPNSRFHRALLTLCAHSLSLPACSPQRRWAPWALGKHTVWAHLKTHSGEKSNKCNQCAHCNVCNPQLCTKTPGPHGQTHCLGTLNKCNQCAHCNVCNPQRPRARGANTLGGSHQDERKTVGLGFPCRKFYPLSRFHESFAMRSFCTDDKWPAPQTN